MNKIDVENIKKEIARRKALKNLFKDGGEMPHSDIRNASDEELKKFLKDFENKSKEEAGAKIRKLVDEFFNKYGGEGDTMIPISAANRYDYSIDGFYDIDVYDEVNLSIDAVSNPDIKVIGRNWDEDDKRWEQFGKDLANFNSQVTKLGKIPTAEDFWEDDGDFLNEYWYGVIVITKDYVVQGFEIRNDGLAQNDKKINYPEIDKF
jgi:hypothetical protein